MGTFSFSKAWIAFALAACASCGDGAVTDASSSSGGTAPDGTKPPGTPVTPPDPGPKEATECAVGAAVCTGKAGRRVCVANGAGSKWTDESCASGSGCWQAACAPSKCSDECTLGETKN